MKISRALAVVTALALAATGGASGPAAAAAPTITRIPVDVLLQDDILTDACGVDVALTAKGSIAIREFPRDGVGPLFLLTANVTLTLTAGDNSFRLKDVGANLVRRTPEGDLIAMTVGQLPFGFKGALRVNLDTGEVLNEPRDLSEQQIEQACAALTA